MSAWQFIFSELLNISLKLKEAVLRCVYFDLPNFINLMCVHCLTEVRSDSVTCSYCHENWEHNIYIKKIILLQEASIRALKMSGGRFEAALEFLPKQQQQQQQQNEPVNGMSKGASSGKLVNLLLHDPLCVK